MEQHALLYKYMRPTQIVPVSTWNFLGKWKTYVRTSDTVSHSRIPNPSFPIDHHHHSSCYRHFTNLSRRLNPNCFQYGGQWQKSWFEVLPQERQLDGNLVSICNKYIYSCRICRSKYCSYCYSEYLPTFGNKWHCYRIAFSEETAIEIQKTKNQCVRRWIRWWWQQEVVAG